MRSLPLVLVLILSAGAAFRPPLGAADGAAAAATRGSLSVGSATAPPGEVRSGWIDVPAAPSGEEPGARLPVSVAHGARGGPVLALIAGTHGYEYTSVLALQRLLPQLEPGRMRGSVILVHMANPPSFYGRRVYYGPDGKNLNRVYPGRAEGTLSERIADAITREVIDRSTHLVDMHCGDGNESLRPYVYWTLGGDAAVDEQSRQMALAYGLDHIIVDRDRPLDREKSVYTANTAILRGKPALTTESGGMGLTDEVSVGAHLAGALSLMAHLGILDAPSIRVEKPLWILRSEVVRAPAGGVWRPAVEKMQSVASGTLLGAIADPFGKAAHEIRAPFAGEILYVVATPPVSEGEPLAYVGQVSEALPEAP